MTLHPDRYKVGYGGGYGYPRGGKLSIPNITIKAQNLSVREILDKIVTAAAYSPIHSKSILG